MYPYIARGHGQVTSRLSSASSMSCSDTSINTMSLDAAPCRATTFAR